MTKNIYALHTITDKNKIPFQPRTYSKFKFGDKDVSREFGYKLADGFVKSVFFENIVRDKLRVVVISSPYCFIPTATFAMKNYFVQFLNQRLVEMNCKVVEETKIHRTITYKEDYGELSAEERMKLISNDGFEIDTNFIKGKFLIFLDDIKITGSHEKVIIRMMTRYNITNDHVFVYFAKLDNPEIDPRIENFLNYAYVKSLLDLDRIIKNKNFIPNTRVVKYILNYKDPEEFKNFVIYQSKQTLSTIYHLAIGNSYHEMEEYKANLAFIRKTLIEYKHFLVAPKSDTY